MCSYQETPFCYTELMNIKRGIVAFISVAAVISGVIFISRDRVIAPTKIDSGNSVEADSEKEASTTDTSSEIKPIIINKRSPLPMDFVTDLVVPDVRLRLDSGQEQMQIDRALKADLEAMFSAAQLDGVELVFGSGYRSREKQAEFYESYAARDGVLAADTYSARPGYSEHQSGLSFDATSADGTCHLELCWEDTPEGKWMASNAPQYGFIIRYPKNKESITGYQYEPWHFRYVRVANAPNTLDDAERITKQNLTFEEYYGHPAAPDYSESSN